MPSSNEEGKKPGIIPPPEPSPFDLEPPGGVMHVDSRFYIERKTDEAALKEILRQGTTIVIKGPCQVGKSSLLLRIQRAAEQANKKIALVDLQLFDKAALIDADAFYRQFCFMVTDAVGLDDQTEAYWALPSMNLRCTRYFERYLLTQLEKQQTTLVLALDNAERILDADFSSDFYGMLRSWHELRHSKSLWKRLDLVLVTSTEPYQLIEKPTQSPFNVGLVLEWEDFDKQQVERLIERHGLAAMQDRIEDLWNLLEGHPYLTQWALFVVSSGYSVESLFTEPTRDKGPFGDHLRHHYFRLQGQKKLIAGMLQIIEHNLCQDMETLYRLRSAGLIRETVDNKVKPRCKLYAGYFRDHLHG